MMKPETAGAGESPFPAARISISLRLTQMRNSLARTPVSFRILLGSTRAVTWVSYETTMLSTTLPALGPVPQPQEDEAEGLDVVELLDLRGRGEDVGEADLGEEQRQLLLAEVVAAVDLGLRPHLLRQYSHGREMEYSS